MREILLIGMGGFFGAVLRYATSGAVHSVKPSFTFPFGTLVVNVIGTFVLALLVFITDSLGVLSPSFRSFAFIGLLGAFTTFSTFSLETSALLLDGEILPAIGNIVANLGLCLLAAWFARATVLWVWG